MLYFRWPMYYVLIEYNAYKYVEKTNKNINSVKCFLLLSLIRKSTFIWLIKLFQIFISSKRGKRTFHQKLCLRQRCTTWLLWQCSEEPHLLFQKENRYFLLCTETLNLPILAKLVSVWPGRCFTLKHKWTFTFSLLSLFFISRKAKKK